MEIRKRLASGSEDTRNPTSSGCQISWGINRELIIHPAKVVNIISAAKICDDHNPGIGKFFQIKKILKTKFKKNFKRNQMPGETLSRHMVL